MKPTNLPAIFLALACAYSATVSASEVYKWTDEKGVTHYSQRKPVDQQSETVSTKTPGKKAPSYIPFSDEAKAAEKNAEASKKAKQEASKADKQPKAKKPAIAKTEAKPKNEIKKDPATCERAKKDEMALRNNPIVRQGGRLLRIDEKNQQLTNIMEVKKIHCK